MSLIAHWPLNGNLNDYSGNGYTLTNYGAVIDNFGKIGKTYIFNTLYSYAHANTAIYMSTGITTDITKSYTLMGWASQATTGQIIGLNPPVYSGLSLYIEGTTARASVNNATQVLAQSAGLANTWNHIAGVFDKVNGSVKIYVNGELKQTTVWDGTHIAGSLFIGTDDPTGPEYNYQGKLNDIRVYDHALSSKEIKLISQAKVLHYKLNDETDSSMYGYHGVGTNMQYSSDAKIGDSCYDNSTFTTSRYITISSAPNITGDQTIAMWLYPTSFGTRENPWNRNYGGEGTITQETNGAFNYYWGTAGSDTTPYQGVGSGFTISLNEWTHIAVVRDITNSQIRWYKNGILQSTTTPSYSASAVSSSPLLIGTGYTSTYRGKIDDVREYGSALSDNDMLQLVQEKASVDKVGNFFSNSINNTKHKPILLDYTTWQDGQTGSVGMFGQNGDTAENNRVLRDDPWGKTVVVWETTPDAVSGADGGWNTSYVNIDKSYTYRWSVWVRRPDSEVGGTFYLGLNPAPIRNDNGTSQSNPYFTCPSQSSLTAGQWYLVVGHIMPETYTGGRHVDSGWYTVEGGKEADKSYCNLGSNEGRWASSTTSAQHRCYHFYTTNVNSKLQFVYPRIDKIDGTEPSISDLLGGHDSRNYEYIREIGALVIKPLDIRDNLSFITEIDEVTGTSSTQAAQILKDGTLLINGEFSEVD